MTESSALRLVSVSALASGAIVSAQLVIALIAVAGPHAPWPAWDDLTTMGKAIAHPEYDLFAYVAGCAFALGIMGLQAALAARAVRGSEGPPDVEAMKRMAGWQAAAAVLSTAAFLAAMDTVLWTAHDRWRLTAVESALVFVAPALGWAACVFGLLRAGRPLAIAAPGRSRFAVDACVVTGLAAFVAVAPGACLAAQIYTREELFHWNAFAVAPALQFAHGKALGTEVFAQYGVGMPAALGTLYGVAPWTYDGVVTAMAAYGALYFAGLYALLVVVTRSRPIAIGGVALALALTLFAPSWHRLGMATVWQWPSSSPLRSPVDVWFFLAAFGYLVRRNGLWAGLMGGAAALGLVLETDTGVGLCVLLCVLLAHGTWMGQAKIAPMVCAAAFLAVAAAGLGWASRGALFTAPASFLGGWLEAPLNFAGGGEGSLVLLSRATWFHLALFGAMVAAALGAVGTAGRAAYGKRERPEILFLGAVGLFTLFRLIVFVQRSTPTNLWHAGVPVAILAAVALGMAAGRDEHAAFKRYAPMLFAALALTAVWLSPSFRTYPSVARALVSEPKPAPLCLPNVLCGLPESYRAEAEAMEAVAEYLRDGAAQGATSGIIDHSAPLHQMAAGVALWGRDTAGFYNLLTVAARDAYIASLMKDGPDLVLIRGAAPNEFFADTWEAVRAALPSAYDRATPVGPFETWTRRP